ncbi:MAG: ATP-binding cassette domain-containing protein [Actinomycetes bacterium]|jgi:iron complex transport system ATP-binding protein
MNHVISLDDVQVLREGKAILGPLSWSVVEGERWVVLGPNGAGKTTLFHLISTFMHPTFGRVKILDQTLGKCDVFELRPRIGLVTNNLDELIPLDELVTDVVLTAAYAQLGRWNEEYDLWDESRALALLTTLGVRVLGSRLFGTLSEGEKKRVLIARAMMTDPEIMLLDEPAAGLDLGGREDLLKRLDLLASDPKAPATIIITHHIEEIPLGTTHALLLNEGKVVASGPIQEVVTDQNLSVAYGLPIQVHQEAGRFFARAQ